MSPWTEFTVQAAAGLVGVFAGVLLALFTERRRQRAEGDRERRRLLSELAEVRRVVLGSVVRNTSEVKRLRTAMADASDDYVFGINLELAVWDATQSHFVRLAPLEERVVLTRFFDQVRRLDGLLNFVRQARADSVVGSAAIDRASPHLRAMETRLLEVAEDLRLAGVVLVTDYGEDMHRRLLGVAQAPAPEGPASSTLL